MAFPPPPYTLMAIGTFFCLKKALSILYNIYPCIIVFEIRQLSHAFPFGTMIDSKLLGECQSKFFFNSPSIRNLHDDCNTCNIYYVNKF